MLFSGPETKKPSCRAVLVRRLTPGAACTATPTLLGGRGGNGGNHHAHARCPGPCDHGRACMHRSSGTEGVEAAFKGHAAQCSVKNQCPARALSQLRCSQAGSKHWSTWSARRSNTCSSVGASAPNKACNTAAPSNRPC